MAKERFVDEREQQLNAHVTRAGELLRGEQLDAADREVAAALRLSPDDVRARNLLGLIRFRGGHYDEAQQIYQALVARDPEDAALRLNLGLVELRLGRNAEAVVSLQKVVEREPDNKKAQGYLGLALMRAGNLAAARQAFLSGGHTDLVRQVEEQMASVSVVKPFPARESARLDGELTLSGATPAAAPPVLDKPKLPTPLSAFVEARGLGHSDASEPFKIVGELLVARVEGRLPIRIGGALASSGRLSYAPIARRLRGKTTDESLGEGEDALLAASGSGTIVVSPRGGRFTALALGDKDVLYIRESQVFAFEDSLYWENGRIPGGTELLVQFRGRGRVVLRGRKAPWALAVVGGDVLYVDQAALIGWTGEVVPQQMRDLSGESTPFVSLSGEGAIFLEDPPHLEIPTVPAEGSTG